MILYHGSSKIIYKISFDECNLRTDFGKGFYMGSKLGEARKWAVGKAGFSGIPAVMRYNVNDRVLKDQVVNPLIFYAPTLEWLNFVRDNRRICAPNIPTSEPRHPFGAVSGPVADDKANVVVADYCKDKIDTSEALYRIRTIPKTYQLSLHAQFALTYIIQAE